MLETALAFGLCILLTVVAILGITRRERSLNKVYADVTKGMGSKDVKYLNEHGNDFRDLAVIASRRTAEREYNTDLKTMRYAVGLFRRFEPIKQDMIAEERALKEADLNGMLKPVRDMDKTMSQIDQQAAQLRREITYHRKTVKGRARA